MKKRQLLKLSALLVLCCAMFGCGKGKETTVYGTVFRSNGTPVSNLKVTLEYHEKVAEHGSIFDSYVMISSTVTGTDGQYEIVFPYNPTYANSSHGYYIHLGNKDYSDRYQIEIQAGKMNRFDLRY